MGEGAGFVLEGVAKERKTAAGEALLVLKDVDLRLGGGALTVIVGPSGGGKSTLLRLLNRLEDPDAGRIRLGGRDLAAIPPLELRRRVGLVLQTPYMFPGTVLENLQRPFALRGSAVPGRDDAGLQRVLKRCGLEPELLERDARSLSVGQQQRVNLARTLLPGPEVLLLDEPTSALDRPTADRLAATLQAICRQERVTVVTVTHDLRLAERIAEFVVYLAGGRIVEAGPAGALPGGAKTEEFRRFLAGLEEGEGAS